MKNHSPHKTYKQRIGILKKACRNFGGYEGMLFPAYVELYGLNDFDISIEAMAHFTRFSSAEFAVRPFIAQYPEQMFKQLSLWAESTDPHIRRLASEGCRPRLPWATSLPALKADPSAIFPVLDKMMTDESLYVRKSVANNLNDISKDHPALVLAFCRAWKNRQAESEWIIKRACRSLLKNADAETLSFFEYSDVSHYRPVAIRLSCNKLMLGDTLEFTFPSPVVSALPVKTRLEFAIHFVGKNRPRRKVFHLHDGELDHQPRIFRHTYSFSDKTTRKHYPGEHLLELLVNGQKMASAKFTVF
ncbi:MAG: DNA alkylation repair protein [Pseudomonadales bacterium]|nr:DNA alkylation repair protein [Pseudomonadales bacterium]